MKKADLSNHELLRLENSLRQTLHPVYPDQKFVGSLRRQLNEEACKDSSHRLAVSFLTIAAGLIAGLVVILIGRILIKEKG
jgi:hypothetical protein